MIHIYILDYTVCRICHASIACGSEDEIETYITDKLGFDLFDINYMVSDTELNLTEL